MTIFEKDDNGEVQGRYKCEKCDIILPLNKDRFIEGYNVIDMVTLEFTQYCRNCMKEFMEK